MAANKNRRRVRAGLGAILPGLVAAMVLAGCASDIPYGALEARYDTPVSHYLEMPGGLHVRYRDEGPPGAPVLLMIHGFSASLEAWEPWANRLTADYRVISLDLPGHGLTRAPASWAPSIDAYADLTDAVAARLGVRSYVVIGNSMGGAAAWDDALRQSGHVRGLVLVDAAGWPGEKSGRTAPLLFDLMRSAPGRAMLRHIDTAPMARAGLKTAYVDRALVTPALVGRYVDYSRAPGHRDLLLRIRSRPATPIDAGSFKAITAPTLVMHGEADALVPLADGRAFAAAIPGARLITYPGVGHVPMEQIPDRSVADLRRFLAGLPTTRAY
jgi:pimeloyl-ACP methyl ester carboxylesterase